MQTIIFPHPEWDKLFVFKILKVNNESKTHIFKISHNLKPSYMMTRTGERRDVCRTPLVLTTRGCPCAFPAWQRRRCGEPNGMEGHLEARGVSGGLTCPPGQEELSPRIPRVPPVLPLLKAPVALASETGEVLPPRFTLVPVGDDESPQRPRAPPSTPSVKKLGHRAPPNLPVPAAICCDQHPLLPFRSPSAGSMAPDPAPARIDARQRQGRA